jgi:four helix bundle protein
MKYDLEERVSKFGENIIGFAQIIEKNEIIRPIIVQLIRSGTSVGANYLEANEASSKKDFKNKIFIAKKESNETKHWLRMIIKATPKNADTAKILWQESHE